MNNTNTRKKTANPYNHNRPASPVRSPRTAAPSGKPMRKKRRTRKPAVLLIAAVVLLLLIIPYCIACGNLKDNVIWKKSSINGVSVKGLTKEEAAAALETQFINTYQNFTLKVQVDGQEYPVNVYPLLGMDASGQIEKAYQPGHRLWILRAFDRICTSLFSGKDQTVYPYIKYPENIDSVLTQAGLDKYDSTVDSSWEVQDDKLIIHKGKEGVCVNAEQLEQDILSALSRQDYDTPIPCPITTRAPKSVNLQEIYNTIHTTVSNATLDPANNYELVPSSTGIDFNTSQAQTILDNTQPGADAVISLEVVQPEISTEDMQNNLFQSVLASYSTYGGGTSERCSNLSLAAQSCDGTILLPGETFSYNATLGERTLERGYQYAGAYSDKEVIQEIGGGICQVSSTIFAALLYTDLEIVERHNHSMEVSYLPSGMDATVSWGGPDFQFRNNTKYPIKLNVYYDWETVTVDIIGTQESDQHIDVSVEYSEGSYTTYRTYYDSNWNYLTSVQVATSTYSKIETEESENDENTESENTDDTGNDPNADQTQNTDGTGDAASPENTNTDQQGTDTGNYNDTYSDSYLSDDSYVEEIFDIY